ncbi:MAG: alpha/beta hydrolase [Actinomycetota bacterium]|nr:alpha/beta hydrolase [Actinomycetota bacterium]
MQHRTLRRDGPLHVVDFGGRGQPIVLLHGLGGSHANWISVGERLAEHGRVVALDLVGHGLTPPVGRRARIVDHRRLVQRYLGHLDQPAVLAGNSMGGYVALTVAASTPELVAGVILVGAALPREKIVPRDPLVLGMFAVYMIPGLADRFLSWRRRRLRPEGLVEQALRLCSVDASRIADEAWEAHVEMAHERILQPWSRRCFLQSARSLVVRMVGRRRVADMIEAIEAPALIIQGDRDRLVPVEVARDLARRRPDWQLEVFTDIGHVPQLEAPDRFIEVVDRWLHGSLSAQTTCAS